MDIEAITAQNPWWKGAGWEKQDRHLKQLALCHYVYHRKHELKKGIVVLYGPRQVGKTTWVKQAIFSLTAGKSPLPVLYLNAEMFRDRFELQEAVKAAYSINNPDYVFIDEINAVEDWEKAVKVLADEGAFEGKRVVLTGSSALNIMKKAERLPGRMAQGQYKFRYYPLSFSEVAALYGISPKSPGEAMASLDRLNPVLYRYFIHGGFIRAINAMHGTDALGEDLFSIYAAWIDGELARARRSPETGTRILDGISICLTNECSWSSLARNVSHVTVADYAETLKDMFVINYLEKAKRAGAGAPKNKKIYFTDPFIYWLALFKSRKLSSVSLSDTNSVTAGKLAELSAYAAIVYCLDGKHGENEFDPRRYVHFEKSRSGETDFIMDFGNGSIRLECKFGGIGKEKEGVVYLTRNELGKNKVPLAVFMLFPEASLKMPKP